MKQAIAAVAILLTAIARADEVSDRTGVERTISALNDARSDGEARKLATGTGYNELARLLAFDTRPWSEVSRPYFMILAIRFIGPNVALVDAARSQYGTWIMQRIPLMLVMKRESNVWRIASVRILVADP